MGRLLVNIKALCGISEGHREPLRKGDLNSFEILENAWLLMEDGKISGFGPMSGLPDDAGHEMEDLSDKFVLPAYCDSHSHLVFATYRESEFADRIKGFSYEEIASRGGGIINSAAKLRAMDEDELFEVSKERLFNVIRTGTGAIEIKSGYGLSLESELKMLRVIRRLRDLNRIPIKSTLLAAHALPSEFRSDKKGYVKMITDELIPEVVKEGLADYIDIFCEQNYFDVEDTRLMLEKGLESGLKGKIHVNQFNILGGVKAGVDGGALSVDHLELLDENDVAALSASPTIATLLPGCSFFLGIEYAPARKLIDGNVAVALASDFNPGSSPGGNMNFVVSLACIKLKMTIAEAFNAATINAAFAMEVENEAGSITPGKRANLIVSQNIPSLTYIPYSYSESSIRNVYINGEHFAM